MNAVVTNPEALLARFGLTAFRPGQRDVIDAIMGGQDVLCVMPTGGGKSLCFQLPALARQGTTIVVSPLIALMKDQVDTLKRRGISATLINSSLTPAEQEEAMQRMAASEFSLVYVAPERLRNGRFLEAVAKANVTLLAIDEAHCVSEWGHDFRPDYARLGHFRFRYLNGVQTIALTATATPYVRQDIQSLLGMRNPREFVTGFGRDNLRFSVEHFKSDREKNEALLQFVRGQSGAGIIYASTRKRCEEIADWLPQKLGKPIGVYHAGLEAAQRHAIQNDFMAGRLAAIIATNAFGMGIDKSDIRYVVHYNIPGSLEAYYQEAGRAGRDGRMSECRLLFAYSDRYIQEFFIENRYPSPEIVDKVYRFLLSREEDPIELTLEQVREAIAIKETAESVGTAETLLAKAGVLKRLDNSMNTAVIRIDSDLPTLVDLLPREAKLRRKVLRAAEIVIGDRRGEDVYVRPQKLAEMADVDREQLSRTLRELARLKQFDYVPPFRGRAVHIVQRDVPFADLKIDFDELSRRKAAEYEKLEAVIEFARTAKCRQRAVLEYFGDPHVSNCKKCDRCDPEAKCMPMADGSDRTSLVEAAIPQAADYDLQAFSRGIRVVLSGIARMHGRFGKALIAQMLGGSNNKKIQQWKLNRLSTFGLLSGLKQTQLTELIDSLIEVGLAAQNEVDERRPTVRLTEDGEAVMFARVPIPESLRIAYPLAKRLAVVSASIERGDVSAEAVTTGLGTAGRVDAQGEDPGETLLDHAHSDPHPWTETVSSTPLTEHQSASSGVVNAATVNSGADPSGAAAAIPALSEHQDELKDRLRRWRGKTSAALGIPAYRVLSNATIDRIVERWPRSTSELEEIQGVGTATIEQFGCDIMNLLEEVQTRGEPLAEVETVRPQASPSRLQSNHPQPHRPAPVETPPARSLQEPAPASSSASESRPGLAQPSPLATKNPESVAPGDAYWTWRLFRDGYTKDQICQIRCRDAESVVRDLRIAEVAGHAVHESWLQG